MELRKYTEEDEEDYSDVFDSQSGQGSVGKLREYFSTSPA